MGKIEEIARFDSVTNINSFLNDDPANYRLVYDSDSARYFYIVNLHNRKLKRIPREHKSVFRTNNFFSQISVVPHFAHIEKICYDSKFLYVIGDEGYLNTYMHPDTIHNFNKDREYEFPKIYKDFFDVLFSTDESRKYALEWVAGSLREKLNTYLVLISYQKGVGKGIFGGILSRLHGEDNSHIMDNKSFNSRFTGEIEGKTLVFCDELQIKDDDADNFIKTLVNPYFKSEKKGVDAVKKPNYANLVIASNHANAVKITNGERRYSILDLRDGALDRSDYVLEMSDASKKCPSDFVMSWVAEMNKDENIAELYGFLRQLEITTDINKNYIGEYGEDIIDFNIKEWVKVVLDFLRDNEGKRFTLEDIKKLIIEKADLVKTPSTSTIVSEVKSNIPRDYTVTYTKPRSGGGSSFLSVRRG